MRVWEQQCHAAAAASRQRSAHFRHCHAADFVVLLPPISFAASIDDLFLQDFYVVRGSFFRFACFLLSQAIRGAFLLSFAVDIRLLLPSARHNALPFSL